MNYLNFLKVKGGVLKEKILGNKRLSFSILAIILFLLVYAIFVRGYIEKQVLEKEAIEKQIEEETNQEKKEEKLKNAKFSRISFFLAGPIRASLAIPDYLEGNYRIREAGNRVNFLYIKNPDFATPFFYVKYLDKDNFSLEEGEIKVSEVKSKKDSKTYVLIYYFYPEDSYKGESEEEAEGFKEALWDMKNIIIESLKTF